MFTRVGQGLRAGQQPRHVGRTIGEQPRRQGQRRHRPLRRASATCAGSCAIVAKRCMMSPPTASWRRSALPSPAVHQPQHSPRRRRRRSSARPRRRRPPATGGRSGRGQVRHPRRLASAVPGGPPAGTACRRCTSSDLEDAVATHRGQVVGEEQRRRRVVQLTVERDHNSAVRSPWGKQRSAVELTICQQFPPPRPDLTPVPCGITATRSASSARRPTRPSWSTARTGPVLTLTGNDRKTLAAQHLLPARQRPVRRRGHAESEPRRAGPCRRSLDPDRSSTASPTWTRSRGAANRC